MHLIPERKLQAISVLAALLFLLVPPSSGQESGRPKFSFLRQAEDWSGFVSGGDDFFDPIKRVSLSDDGEFWVSFGGRVEARFENWRSFNFGAPVGASHDDSFTVSRGLLHADLHMGSAARFFVEGKTAQATDRNLPGGRRPLDMDTLALQQAFLEVALPVGDDRLVVRPGRQALLFGKQRLVSPLPWGNTLRTWEGVTADWVTESWKIVALATYFVPVDKTEPNHRDKDTTLYGVYASRKPVDGNSLDVYALGNSRKNVTVNGTTGNEDRITLGSRIQDRLPRGFDYEVEGAYQVGEVGSADVRAWFISAQLGLKIPDWLGEPRMWVGADLASGDKAAGGNVQTFHQLFPLGHAYFGYIDAVGRQNISDFSLGSKFRVTDKSDLLLAFHSFRVLEASDALYNAGGGVSRTGFSSRDVGLEIDALVNLRLARHAKAYLGYSHFFTGDALKQTGPAEDVDFVYVGFGYTF